MIIASNTNLISVVLLGVLLMAASENEDNDILWCINHDSFPFQKPMMETQVLKKTKKFGWNLDIIFCLSDNRYWSNTIFKKWVVHFHKQFGNTKLLTNQYAYKKKKLVGSFVSKWEAIP